MGVQSLPASVAGGLYAQNAACKTPRPAKTYRLANDDPLGCLVSDDRVSTASAHRLHDWLIFSGDPGTGWPICRWNRRPRGKPTRQSMA